jgi:hypothetical protein
MAEWLSGENISVKQVLTACHSSWLSLLHASGQRAMIRFVSSWRMEAKDNHRRDTDFSGWARLVANYEPFEQVLELTR